MNNRKQSKFGFTLVEMLVVVAILTVLLAVLLPTYFESREKARSNQCLSNLRQLGQALTMYVRDYDDAYPTIIPYIEDDKTPGIEAKITWRDLLMPYLRNPFFTCQSRSILNRLSRIENNDVMSGYGYNASLNNIVPIDENASPIFYKFEGKIEPIVLYPSLTVAIFDARTGIEACYFPDTNPKFARGCKMFAFIGFEEDILSQKEGARRHQGGANYVFLDGHAKWHTPEQFHLEPTADGVRPGFSL